MITSSNGHILRITDPFCGDFPAEWPVRRSFDASFDLRLNKRLSKQSWGWWLETSLRLLWRHCNGKNAHWAKVSPIRSHIISEEIPWHLGGMRNLDLSGWSIIRIVFQNIQHRCDLSASRGRWVHDTHLYRITQLVYNLCKHFIAGSYNTKAIYSTPNLI